MTELFEPPIAAQQLFALTDQVAVVTGASSGLGERFVRVLHAAGASVVAVARRAERLEALAREHERVLPVVADLSSSAQVEEIVPATLERFGRLDVLVNNAGLGTPGPAADYKVEDFRYVLEVNLVGTFHLAREAARPMAAEGSGSIINVASILGTVAGWPIPDPAYAASKAGVINLTRDLACQWARSGVRVNALAPGFFPTEATQGMEEQEGARRYLETGCPMRRMGRVDELDGALLFLASSASTYMTGQTLIVDGGWTAH